MIQGGLASLGSGLGVGLIQLSPLVGGHDTLHLVHAVLVGQQGAVILEDHGIAVLVLLDHLNVQSVVDEQSSVVTVQVLSGGSGQVIKDTQGRSQRGGLDGPGSTGQTLNLGVVADSHQQHLGGLIAGNRGSGVEGAVATAGNDAQAVAVVDVALGPAVVNVSQASLEVGVQIIDVSTLVQDGGNHLSHLGTGHIILGGIIRPIFLAVDHAQNGEHGNGVLVDDLVLIGEVVNTRSTGADYHHAHQHESSQNQTESPLEVSHWEFLLIFFRPWSR